MSFTGGTPHKKHIIITILALIILGAVLWYLANAAQNVQNVEDVQGVENDVLNLAPAPVSTTDYFKDWKTYVDEDQALIINYPSDWEYNIKAFSFMPEDAFKYFSQHLASDCLDSADGFCSLGLITDIANRWAVISVEAIPDDIEDHIDYLSAKGIKVQEVSKNNRIYYEYLLEPQENSPNYKSVYLVSDHGGTVEYSLYTSELSKYRDIFDLMFRRLGFTLDYLEYMQRTK